MGAITGRQGGVSSTDEAMSPRDRLWDAMKRAALHTRRHDTDLPDVRAFLITYDEFCAAWVAVQEDAYHRAPRVVVDYEERDETGATPRDGEAI